MNWYALRTTPMKEFAVEQILRHRDVTCFVPIETKWRRVGAKKKRKPIKCPMLPRYVLMLSDDPWAVVRHMQGRGVSGVVCFNGQPARIPQHSVDWLARSTGTAVPNRSARVHRAFAPGDKVEIVSGPFQGWCVELKEIKGEVGRVMLKLFGNKERPVPIRLDQLEAA